MCSAVAIVIGLRGNTFNYLAAMLSSSFKFFNKNQLILVFGRDGQVGRALQKLLKDLKVQAVFLGRDNCDLTCRKSIVEVLNRYQPRVIINAAAYTAVDRAERESELAFAINAKAPKLMAQYIANVNSGVFIHYSTDYVFADTKQEAYLESDIVGPVEYLNIYGQSKLVGEQSIEEVFKLANKKRLPNYPDLFARYFILRTSWVYGDGGNFIRTILRLANECDQLKVVADQVGTPTSAQWLADISMQFVSSRVESGVYNVVPDGQTSWHGLAIFAIGFAASFEENIKAKSKKILPISTLDYPVIARRPYNSCLSNAKLKKTFPRMVFSGEYPHWQDQVKIFVKDYLSNL